MAKIGSTAWLFSVASQRGSVRGAAMPLLLDLARKPNFLHDTSVASLDSLLNPRRGAMAPRPFYLAKNDEPGLSSASGFGIGARVRRAPTSAGSMATTQFAPRPTLADRVGLQAKPESPRRLAPSVTRFTFGKSIETLVTTFWCQRKMIGALYVDDPEIQ